MRSKPARVLSMYIITVGLLALLLAPLAASAQSVVPIAPQPPDMPPPGPFVVTTIGYQALPPNDHYSSAMLATGAGTTFGYAAGGLIEYNSATPQDLTFNFGFPIQVQYGNSPQTVLGVDSVTGNYVGQSTNGRCYVATPGGVFSADPVAPALAFPLPPNEFLGSYQSVCTGSDNGRVVGTASLSTFVRIPLSGGDGAGGTSGPGPLYQFPILGVGDPIVFPSPACCTRARGIRGNQVVGDFTAAATYDPANSLPGLFNSLSSAFVWDTTQPLNSLVLLAGIPSMAVVTDGTKQGGWSGLNNGTGDYHATMWSGTAVSAVDLNPPGYFNSRVTGMTTEFQVGDGWLGGPANSPGATQHALLWHGTPESVVDLNQFLPPSIVGAEINGADADGNIVGAYSFLCAVCTAASLQQIGFIMNLNPSTSLTSLTFDVSNPAPGDSVIGMVTLGAPAPAGGVSVSFTTSDASLVPAPPSVLIPGGQTGASFTVPTNPNTLTTFMAAPAVVTLVAHTTYTARSATLTVTPAAPADPIVSLTLTPATVHPGDTAAGVVTLTRPAPNGGVIVNFSSANPALLPTPVSLVISAGASSASFSVVANDANSLFFGPAPVVLQGETGNVVTQTTLTIARVIKPGGVILGTPQNSVTSVQGGTSGVGFIPLSATAEVTGTITLTNTNPAITLPASVSVQAGAWLASVPWTTLPVATLTTGTATASLNGFTSSNTLSVTASPSPSLQSLVIPMVPNTKTLTGTVTLSGPAFLGGMTVSLASDTPAAAQVPASVIVPAGATSATFNVVLGLVGAPTTATITATLAGFVPASVALTVTSPSIQSLAIPVVSNTRTFSSGQTLTGTVTLSGPAFLGDMTVSLASDTPAAAQVPASIIIPNGATSATFSVVAGLVAGPTKVTISASLGFAPVSATLTVIPGPALAIQSYTLSPYAMIGPGVVTTGTITLNQPAPAGGVTLALSALNPQPAKFPATVTFAQGQTSANVTVQGNGVSGVTTTTLIASYNGVLAPLGTSANVNLTVAPTDTLHVTKATWSKSTQTLTVTATSTNPQAIITVLNANGNVPIGTMTNLGSGNYTFQMTIASIASVNIKSNLGGSTGQGVTVVF